MKIRHFLLLLVVGMSWLVFGCTPTRGTGDYLQSGGCGEVRGSMSGMEFCAVVEISATGDCVRVEYLTPDSLCGLILVSDGKVCEVVLGELSFTCDTCEVLGFLRPVTAFLQTEDAASVQRVGENTVLTFFSGEVLTLSPTGAPLSFAGENIDLRMVWWQSGGKTEHGS